MPGITRATEGSNLSMALILDTDDDIFLAADATDMAWQLVALLPADSDDETLARLAAVALGCDVLDVVITRTKPRSPS